ncbi:MAG: hypothetical protein ABR543_13715 [Gemmatimonadaceae bacterium]
MILCVATLVSAAVLVNGVPVRTESASPPVRGAIPTVTVTGPIGSDTLSTITPTFTVRTANVATAERPLTIRLQISSDPTFTGPFLVDTAVQSDSVTIVLARPLPERAQIFWRAVVRTVAGDSSISATGGPRFVPQWLTLIFPNAPNGTTLDARRPEFVWSSAGVASPPGPWIYDLTVTNAGTGQIAIMAVSLLDTMFVPASDLESNTPYRWSVAARLATGDSTRQTSRATFVVFDATTPLATLLFQNFPNPFPSVTSPVTCVWFDLRQAGTVQLDVLDIRGHAVRTLIPSQTVSSSLPAGRYGRANADVGGLGTGCDERFTWDGSDTSGRIVPSGVYLLRLRADGVVSVRKMVFRGR